MTHTDKLFFFARRRRQAGHFKRDEKTGFKDFIFYFRNHNRLVTNEYNALILSPSFHFNDMSSDEVLQQVNLFTQALRILRPKKHIFECFGNPDLPSHSEKIPKNKIV